MLAVRVSTNHQEKKREEERATHDRHTNAKKPANEAAGFLRAFPKENGSTRCVGESIKTNLCSKTKWIVAGHKGGSCPARLLSCFLFLFFFCFLVL